MNDATQLTYVCRSNDELLIILARLARVTTREYPIVLYQMRRETFLSMLDDPAAVDCDTPPVSEWQDARNSRPLPY
jgi:hypothetical protein